MSGWQKIETAPRDGTKILTAAFSDRINEWVYRNNWWRVYCDGASEGWGSWGYPPEYWTHLPPATAGNGETSGENP